MSNPNMESKVKELMELKRMKEELEAEISALPYQMENIVVGLPKNGDDRDLVVALKIVYDPEQFAGMSKEEIEKRIHEDVDKINDRMPLYKHIKRIFITDEPMIKTSTSKVRRFLEIEKMLEEENKDGGTDGK